MGNPTHPGACDGPCSLVVFDQEVYEVFRDQCISKGKNPETDPSVQILHEPDRPAFLEICEVMTRLAPILGLTIMAVEKKNADYDAETISGLTPTETLAEVPWGKNGYKAAFGLN